MKTQNIISICGLDLQFRDVSIDDRTPTGAQISAAAGFNPSQQVTVLRWLPDGSLEDIRPDESLSLAPQGERFIVVESDGSFRITVDGRRFDWPARRISGSALRLLGKVPDNKTIYFERRDEADQPVDDHDVIDLAQTGVEAFYSRQGSWILNVQNVRLAYEVPIVVVREAIARAGFDTTQAWHIFLKVRGEPKKEVSLDDQVDLRTPGIEKLRLTPKDVNNGDGAPPQRFHFSLLPADEAFLDEHYARWEAVIENGHRWLIIPGFKVPRGYQSEFVTLALDIPDAYPGAQIDMFYVHPVLLTLEGNAPPNTEARVTVDGAELQRWSRHRGETAKWRPESDNVITHLALVEAALLKEVAQ